MRLWKSTSPAVLVLGGLLALAGNSTAASVTSVDLNAGTVTALVGLGFSIAPIAPATLTGLDAVFPVTGVTSTAILHSGGLAFTQGTTTLDLTNFTINLLNDTLYATANGSATQIAFLDLGAGGALTLDSVAANALSTIFTNVPNLTGAAIGTATVTPEPGTAVMVLAAGLAAAISVKRSRRASC